MNEEWRPTKNPDYLVSSWGRVKSIKFRKEKILKPMLVGKGYHRISMRSGGYCYIPIYVHHLVLEAFHGPRPEGMEAIHLDENKTNNHKDNLKWGTSSENHFRRWGHR